MSDTFRPQLLLAREIEALSNCIQLEAMQSNCSRAFLEAYSARLLKTSARLYAATLPPAAPTISPGDPNAT
jgi:hypothetical protein